MIVSRRPWSRAATAAAGAAVAVVAPVPAVTVAVAVAGLAAVAALVAGCAVVGGDEAPAPVVVGVDLALTGSGSARDSVFRQALDLRAEQLNALRGRSGDGRPRVELRVRDNASDPDTAAANLTELAADPRVSAIITGGCGECVIDAAAGIDAAAVPVIALAAPRAVAEPVAERRFLFRIGPDAAGSADLIAAALADRGAARVGLVTSDDRYGEDGARELVAAAGARGIDVAVHEVTGDAAGQRDRARSAAAMTGWRTAEVDPYGLAEPAGLDAVVLWTPEPVALGLAVALREAGWDGPVWLDTGAAGDLFQVGPAAAALSGARLLFTDTLVMDDVVASLPDLARRRQWFDSYLSRYGTYHAPASFAADALDLILAATDRIGADPARVRDTLEAIRLPGLSGPVGFSPSDHSGLDARSLSVLRFAGDRWHATGT